MKHFTIVIVFLFLSAFACAQVPGHNIDQGSNTLTVARNIKHHLFVSFNGGVGAISDGESPMGMFPHLEVNGKYFLFGHLALMVKTACDINSSDIFPGQRTAYTYDEGQLVSECLGGICLMANSQYSDVQFSFISLTGFAQDHISWVVPQPYYSPNLTLNSSGPAFYEGFECTHLMHKFRWNLGMGYLFSNMYYPGYTQYGSSDKNIMSLGILEIYMGISIPAISPK